MPKQPNRKMIGLFVISGFVALLLIIGGLTKDKIFRSNDPEVVMYFEESINGLTVGAPLVLKGVKIGEVTKIKISADVENLTFSIPVYARLQTKRIKGPSDTSNGRAILKALIEKGLRARLTSLSMITGQLMIELEMLPDVPIVYHGNKKVPEIPTALSPFSEFSRGLQEIPIQEGVQNFTEFFRNLNKNTPEINKSLDALANSATRSLTTSTEVMTNFNKTLQNISRAAKSMQNLTDYLERHPESLLKGKK